MGEASEPGTERRDLRVLAGIELGGANLTRFDDHELGQGSIGQVTWGPRQLLRDLELRLGLGAGEEPDAVRVATWAERMSELAPLGRFYTRSSAIDPLGTAKAVLALRDRLVAAEWSGEPISGGGPRLEAIAELEALKAPALPAGAADRVVTVRQALASSRVRPYAKLALAEPRQLWDASWLGIFEGLERTGTRLTRDIIGLPGAPRDSDLGQVQQSFETGAPIVFRADGTFALVTAETSWEAAQATAAMLAGLRPDETVIIREDDDSALDNALAVHGLCTQGWHSTSPWRAALQVLPLALELAFEPKDPYRVLELLTLPIGPFQGFSGHRLARALAESPGIGSPDWEKAKTEIQARSASTELVIRIGEWFEQRGTESLAAAPKSHLLAVVARVRDWMISRLPGASEDSALLTAVGLTGALRAALESDPRKTFTLVEVRRLAESVLGPGITVQFEPERAGRLDHVSSASGLRVPRETVVWWAFAGDRERLRALPWRRQELIALADAGIRFADPRGRLTERASAWRRAILAATRRVILVAPRTCKGKKLSPHPLWDEIVARTKAGGVECITLAASDLVAPSSGQALLEPPPLNLVETAQLPGGHAEWIVPEALPSSDKVSPSSLEALLGCPLKWALRYRAGIKPRDHALPPLVILNGKLGHRLIELLQAENAFELDDAALEGRATTLADELFQREGSVLLRTGMGLERSQLRSRLARSVVALARALRSAGLRIVAIEQPIDVAWRGARLEGRMDLLVASEDGTCGVIDVKTGVSRYRKLLAAGRALQLAAYAFAHASERGHHVLPDAAYFSLKQGRLLGLRSRLWPDADTIDGPTLDQTWRKAERSLEVAERIIGEGRIPVAGVHGAPPLLEALGVDDNDRDRYLALEPDDTCTYCDFKALCGRRWEARA